MSPRQAALETLFEVETRDHAQATESLDQRLERLNFEDRDARLTTALVYGTLRHSMTLDALYAIYLARPLDAVKPGFRVLLRMCTFQAFFMDRIPAYAIGDEAVNLARRVLRATSEEAGFVNGVLRRLLAVEREHIHGRVAKMAAPERLSHPQKLLQFFERRFDAEMALRIAERNNAEPHACLRVNTLRTHADVVGESLAAGGIATRPGRFLAETLILGDDVPLKQLLVSVEFRTGLIYVQDEASQLIAHLVNPRAGERILDYCAAPGGKASHLAELSGGEAQIVAADAAGGRLALVRENVQRLQTPNVEVVHARAVDEKFAPGSFDAVLVDAPCSGLGTLNRHPEIRYRFTRSTLANCADRQSEILTAAAAHVRAGGRLVYSTCTVSHEENLHVVRKFLVAHPEFEMAGAEAVPERLRALRGADGFVRTWPEHLELDGFEAAILVRRTEAAR